MRICVLAEDRTLEPAFGCEHGLSLYVEAAGKRVLFDMGQTDLFLQNAGRMGVDLSLVDFAVLSHGHYDHGGGLTAFLHCNKQAPVFVQRKAWEEHYARRPGGRVDDIGLSSPDVDAGRLRLLDGDGEPADGWRLFSSVAERRLLSASNEVLLIREGEDFCPDPFWHEQNLLIEAEGRRVLLAGCAHRGIVNIMERAEELSGGVMDVVIGGFHLSNPRDGGCESETLLKAIAKELTVRPTRYYTCHCTGEAAFRQLQPLMRGQLQDIRAGSVVNLPPRARERK